MTAVDASDPAPPSATELRLYYSFLNNSSNTRLFQVRATGGDDDMFTFRPGFISATRQDGSCHWVPCNSSQSIDYLVSAVSAGLLLSLYVTAYQDEL
jgi:hypothetical protein